MVRVGFPKLQLFSKSHSKFLNVDTCDIPSSNLDKEQLFKSSL